jgi:hypothetical protein
MSKAKKSKKAAPKKKGAALKKAFPKKKGAAAKKAAAKKNTGRKSKVKPPKGAIWSSHLKALFADNESTEYRAYCNDENTFVGSWQSDFAAEQTDEANHKAKPGCVNHSTTYMIRQGT